MDILEEVAPEVPVRLDGEERQEKIKIVVRQCQASGKSLVAVTAEGEVVGFVLARPDADGGKVAIFINYIGATGAFLIDSSKPRHLMTIRTEYP